MVDARLLDGAPDQACSRLPAHAVEAAERGDPSAQAKVGAFLVDGVCGRGPSTVAAGIAWLERAAAQGDVDAAARLGLLHDLGETGARDEASALHFYRRAAEAGHVAAQHRLGILLVHKGGLAAREEGLYWLGSAASAGDGAAAAALGLMHARGLHGVQRNACLALDWYEASDLLGAPFPLDGLRAELPYSVKKRC